jgi:type IV secretory pathway VirB3-like protein
MSTLQDFSLAVHKSMQQPDLLLGVPKSVLVALLCLGMVAAYMINIVCFLISVVLYIPCYLISKEDPHMLVIALDGLFEPDNLEG